MEKLNESKQLKKWYKKWWFRILVVIVALIIIISVNQYFNNPFNPNIKSYCDQFSGTVNFAWDNGSYDSSICEKAGCKLIKSSIKCERNEYGCGGYYYNCIPK
jgi:hypothetical protein